MKFAIALSLLALVNAEKDDSNGRDWEQYTGSCATLEDVVDDDGYWLPGAWHGCCVGKDNENEWCVWAGNCNQQSAPE